MRSIHTLYTAAVLCFALTACKKKDTLPAEILTNIGNEVIVRTYEDFKTEAGNLQNAILALHALPDSLTFSAARQAWFDTRTPWESSEAFLLGPVVEESIDPSVDSWPVNVTDVNVILNGTQTITAAYIAIQEGNLRGFHTIEYLLWGQDGTKTVAELTPRELEYLVACAQDLTADATLLYNSWSASGDNYVAHLTNVGEDGSIYETEVVALTELVNTLITICDEVANKKIGLPLDAQSAAFEESRYSHNSKSDFANNMRSVLNIYTGTYKGNGSGKGLDDVVLREDEALNTTVIQQINDAIAGIGDIQGNFSDAILNNQDEVRAAQDKIILLLATLQEEVLPLFLALEE